MMIIFDVICKFVIGVAPLSETNILEIILNEER